MQKAMALMMTGDKVSAEEAEEMTMIYKAVEDEDFDETVMTFAEKLSKMPTRALGLTKKSCQFELQQHNGAAIGPRRKSTKRSK
jgi:2-(1,2-epoxy-1,2-dihydrophenyl)acetyl-CoA isomerase